MEYVNRQDEFVSPKISQRFLRFQGDEKSLSLGLTPISNFQELFLALKQEMSSQLNLMNSEQDKRVEALSSQIKDQTDLIMSLGKGQNRECLKCQEHQGCLLEENKMQDNRISDEISEQSGIREKPEPVNVLSESIELKIDLVDLSADKKDLIITGNSGMSGEFSYKKTIQHSDFQISSTISNQLQKDLNLKDLEIEELKIKISEFSQEIEELKNQISQAYKENEELKIQFNQISKENEEFKLKTSQPFVENKELRNKIAKYDKEKEKFRSEIDKLNQETQNIREIYEDTVKFYSGKVKELKEKICKLSVKNKKQMKEIELVSEENSLVLDRSALEYIGEGLSQEDTYKHIKVEKDNSVSECKPTDLDKAGEEEKINSAFEERKQIKINSPIGLKLGEKIYIHPPGMNVSKREKNYSMVLNKVNNEMNEKKELKDENFEVLDQNPYENKSLVPTISRHTKFSSMS